MTKRHVPILTPGQIAIHGGITINSSAFSIEAAKAHGRAKSTDTVTMAKRYFQFLETQYLAEDGTRRQPAKGRFIEHLREVNEGYSPRYNLSACLAGKQCGFKGRVWFWSDLHISHANIIKYCARPFPSTVEMNKTLITNCLTRVTQDDILIFGGDITMTSIETTNALLRVIPAYKINVLGNHDTHKDKLLKLAVDETAACLELAFENQSIFVSHYPVAERVLEPGQFNLHGHIHNTPLPAALGTGARHINMSVENTGYAPMELPTLLSTTPRRYREKSSDDAA